MKKVFSNSIGNPWNSHVIPDTRRNLNMEKKSANGNNRSKNRRTNR